MSDFRAQKSILGYGWPTSAASGLSSWVPAPAINRFSDADEISMDMTIARADLSGRLSGQTGQKTGQRTALNPTGTFTVPFALNKFCLGLIAQHAGAAKNEALISGDSAAWTQVIDPDQTDVDLTSRFFTLYWDKTDGNPQIWHPVGINQMQWQFPVGGEAMLQFTPTPLEFRYYSLATTEAGSATHPMLIRGWLNETNNAVSDRDLYTLVTAYSSPTATCKAAFGATPTGSSTFTITAGVDAEGNPRWTEVALDSSATPIGNAGMRFEAALIDATDVTALDEYSYANPITPLAKVSPTQPVFTSSSTCLSIDGTNVAGLEGLTVTTVNDLDFVPGGICRDAPQAHRRSGTSTVTVEAERAWTTHRHMTDLHDDAQVAIVITFRADSVIDSGGTSGTQFNGTLEIPLGRFADGQGFKTLSNATDVTESLTFVGQPDDSNPQWRLTSATDVEDILS